MSIEATLSTASNLRSHRCYNCNDAFHKTPTVGVSSSFRCPRCFHRHFLPNYTIANHTHVPQHLTFEDFTLSTTNFNTFDYSTYETETDESDFDDLSCELFYSTQAHSPTHKSFLDSFPCVKIDESSKNCSICMHEFGIDTNASQLPCKYFFHYDCIGPWLNKSNTYPLYRHKFLKENEQEIETDLQVILDGEVGGREFQDHNFVLETTASSLSDVGEDDDDLREKNLDEICDEDGDIMMIDA
ncbi:hypothetical protein H5410_005165 [Solanum commersonii]|uniref:RING-type E3 ubiquitin transferase n=1 Tax=Solanum commersonii TaxID=4109 RepID=A0A9J6A6N5_SOLCO|nr:hypothetical protein H5410_005165 [Solanum commersonii]